MAQVGEAMRKRLRRAVRQEWISDEGFQLQEELRKIARANIEKGYEECARSPEPITECYKRVAREKNLADLYRKVWGAPTSGAA